MTPEADIRAIVDLCEKDKVHICNGIHSYMKHVLTSYITYMLFTCFIYNSLYSLI